MALDKVALALAIKGGGGGVTVDTELSTESVNPVQNAVITAALNGKTSARAASITLPTTGWTNDSTEGGNDYPYYIDIADEALTATVIPIATVAIGEEQTAKNCGLSSMCKTTAGAVRFYANTVPAAAIGINMVYIGS